MFWSPKRSEKSAFYNFLVSPKSAQITGTNLWTPRLCALSALKSDTAFDCYVQDFVVFKSFMRKSFPHQKE